MRLVEYLDPSEHLGEVLFGLIMLLTFTLGAGLTVSEGREGVRELLIAALHSEQQPIDLVVFDISAAAVDLGGARMLGRLRDQLASENIELKLAQARTDVRALLQGEELDSLLVRVDRRDDAAEVIAALRPASA